MSDPLSSDSPAETPRRESEAPWASKPSGKRLLRRLLPWLGGAALLALIVWGLWPKPVVVETAAARTGPLTVHVSEEGKTRIRNRYVVAAPVAGNMRRVELKPGDEVIAGKTVLTVIEPAVVPILDPRARVQAEAVVAMRDAGRKQAVQSLEAARADLRLAEAERERFRNVTREGVVSKTDRDRVESEAEVRAAQVRSTEFALQVAEFEWQQARAALERPAADASEGVTAFSPVNGRVLGVTQESERTVAAGERLLEIGDPADLEIEAEILSRDAVTIRPGDAVEIEQWGGEPLKGRVRRVEPAAFTKVSALGVEEQRVIVLSDLTEKAEIRQTLGDRYRVEVKVAVWHRDEVLVVPAGALFRKGSDWRAFVFRDGRAVETAVEGGRSDGRFTEVRGGLSEGDEVLLHPSDTVTDGSRVMKAE